MLVSLVNDAGSAPENELQIKFKDWVEAIFEVDSGIGGIIRKSLSYMLREHYLIVGMKF